MAICKRTSFRLGIRPMWTGTSRKITDFITPTLIHLPYLNMYYGFHFSLNSYMLWFRIIAIFEVEVHCKCVFIVMLLGCLLCLMKAKLIYPEFKTIYFLFRYLGYKSIYILYIRPPPRDCETFNVQTFLVLGLKPLV